MGDTEGFSRREFIKTFTAGALGTLAFGEDALANELVDQHFIFQNGLSILQGFTTSTSTQISIDAPRAMRLHMVVRGLSSGKEHSLLQHNIVTHKKSKWCVHKLKLDHLQMGESYLLEVRNERNQMLDKRVFKTIDSNQSSARIAVMSCMYDLWPTIKKQWRQLELTKPDYVFFIGDSVYGDILAFIDGPDLLWRRFIQARQRIPFYHMHELIPVHAVWDDHDYGLNDADFNYEYKNINLKTFQTFFAQDPVPGQLELGPGNSSAFDAFGQRFIFLDDRFFKNQPGQRANYWGHEQLQWANALIENCPKPLWIAQGCQFFDRHRKPKSSLETKYKAEFLDLKKSLQSANAPALFVSGDVHYSEVNQIEKSALGYETLEVTSSSMHSFRWGKPPQNSRRKHGCFIDNFVVLEVESVSHGLNLSLKCHADHKIKFQEKLIV